MDVIDASHFEVIKQFITRNELWEFKLGRFDGEWVITLRSRYTDPHNALTFMHKSLGEALKQASNWVSVHDAIQKRETEEISLGEASCNSETVAEEVWERDPYDLKDTYGGVLPG